MTDAALPPAVALARPATAAIQKRLKARYAREKRFRAYGLIAIGIAVLFLAVLLGSIVKQGYSAFYTHAVTAEVYLDPAVIDASNPGGANYDQLIASQQLAELGVADDERGTRSTAMRALFSPDAGFGLRERVIEDPTLIGQTIEFTAPIGDDADLYFKDDISRDTPQAQRRLSDEQLAWLDRMEQSGAVTSGFNSDFFTRGDSTQPELAGVLGAVIGSALMLLVTGLLAIPIGVGAAVYLEEFARKNRITAFIEVNINNLAAVPSIVYGLLGLAVFINWMHLPRASPLVGGLVLALMSLPTIIIATRSALKAVPPSIREAALAMGASRTQSVFHHVLPLAMPGVMTGAILAMAHALGETAPLLLIGMVSFTPGIPEGLTSPSGALPVLVYIWENASERAFHERTAAAILVLLAFMIVMNLVAIVLRRRFERRW
ncbi:phosphate ABC transporter permease PstA [Brevundimonas sp.]|uniref:phosphate ABC transporter permease PstA n=1 Tax=Brevundimonas sp. TaxID=1871086 RepID=UPI0035B38191